MAQVNSINSTSACEMSLQAHLDRAGMRLERRGDGYRIMYGAQVLAGNGRRRGEYQMSLAQAVSFTNKALLR
jgi:hypothetical protein